MKKIITTIITITIALVLVSCKPKNDELKIINEEQKLSFNYLWENTNTIEGSKGYGLVMDRSSNRSLASIAAVGFSLASIPSGVENGWITRAEGEDRVIKTLTNLTTLERVQGFYYHFINMNSGIHSPGSEVSIIDTGLLIAGAIVAGEYFGGLALDLAMEIYDEINWDFYRNKTTNMFYMSHNPGSGNLEFSGAWDHISEQLILYVLSAGSRTYSLNSSMYDLMKDVSKRSYTGNYISTSNPNLSVKENFIYTYNGSLFQYQFSHAFIDFRNIVDKDGTNWHQNSILATKAHYAYVQDESHKYKTYGKDSWGLSAGDIPNGYLALGGLPAKNNTHNGTVMPYAAIASINYLEQEAINAANHFKNHPSLWGEYGFKDSFNLGPVDPNYNSIIANLTPWYASDYIGIDKGITILMIENYQSELIWKYFMQNESVQKGLEVLGFTTI